MSLTDGRPCVAPPLLALARGPRRPAPLGLPPPGGPCRFHAARQHDHSSHLLCTATAACDRVHGAPRRDRSFLRWRDPHPSRAYSQPPPARASRAASSGPRPASSWASLGPSRAPPPSPLRLPPKCSPSAARPSPSFPPSFATPQPRSATHYPTTPNRHHPKPPHPTSPSPTSACPPPGSKRLCPSWSCATWTA